MYVLLCYAQIQADMYTAYHVLKEGITTLFVGCVSATRLTPVTAEAAMTRDSCAINVHVHTHPRLQLNSNYSCKITMSISCVLVCVCVCVRVCMCDCQNLLVDCLLH